MEDEELAIRHGASIAYDSLKYLIHLAEKDGWDKDIFKEIEYYGEDWGRTPLKRLEDAMEIMKDIAIGIIPRTWEGKERFEDAAKTAIELSKESGWTDEQLKEVLDGIGESRGRLSAQGVEERVKENLDPKLKMRIRGDMEGKEKYDEDKKRFRGAMDGISKARGGIDTWFGVEDITGDRYSRLEKDKD